MNCYNCNIELNKENCNSLHRELKLCHACNPKRDNIRSIKWRKDNPERSKETKKRRDKTNPEKVQQRKERRKYLKPFTKEKDNIRKKIQRIKLRLETMLAYGNKCVKCNELENLFLTIDHINNNGILEKERGFGFYALLKRLGYPGKGTQLQILCHNCNASKEYVNRRENEDLRKLEPEIYITQPYFISKELDDSLWQQAEDLYNQIQTTIIKKKIQVDLADGFKSFIK